LTKLSLQQGGAFVLGHSIVVGMKWWKC